MISSIRHGRTCAPAGVASLMLHLRSIAPRWRRAAEAQTGHHRGPLPAAAGAAAALQPLRLERAAAEEAQILREIEEMSAAEDAVAYQGKISGSIYSGDVEHYDDKYGYVAVGKSGLCLLAFLGKGHTPTSNTEHSAVAARAAWASAWTPSMSTRCCSAAACRSTGPGRHCSTRTARPPAPRRRSRSAASAPNRTDRRPDTPA